MKTKKFYLEILRVFAIFFVIFVHTGDAAAEYYKFAANSSSYILSILLFVLAQCSVPIFFLISGAVLLQKQDSLKNAICKRALRIFFIILIFGLIQYYYCYYLNPTIGFHIPVFFKLVYSTNVITQYWYLYSYFTFLLILPFIQMLAQNMEKQHFWYLFGLFFLFEGILPIVEYLWGNSRIVLSVPLFASSILFPLLGYYIEHRSEHLFFKKWTLLFVNLAGVFALFTNMVVAYMAHKQRGAAESLIGMTALLSIVIFINCRAICHAISNSKRAFWHCKLIFVLKKLFYFLGAGVFGVYLLEPPLRDSFKFIYTFLQPYFTWFPACFLWINASIFFGACIFHILRKLPILKSLLH